MYTSQSVFITSFPLTTLKPSRLCYLLDMNKYMNNLQRLRLSNVTHFVLLINVYTLLITLLLWNAYLLANMR